MKISIIFILGLAIFHPLTSNGIFQFTHSQELKQESLLNVVNGNISDNEGDSAYGQIDTDNANAYEVWQDNILSENQFNYDILLKKEP